MDYSDQFISTEDRIMLRNAAGTCIAEVTFPAISETQVNLNHTFVDPQLRGQGVAEQLLFAAYKQIQSQNQKIVPTCSYAVSWFQKHPEYQDILQK